jgi:Tfp pilus assembly protein PilN
MNKIYINLNPHKKDTESNIIQSIVVYIPLAGTIAVLLFLIIVFVNLFAGIRLGTLSGYQHRWKQWEGKFKELGLVQKEIASLETEKKELKGIIVPNVDMAKILAAIVSSLPENIWFENISYKKNSLTLKGYAIKWKVDQMASLDKFINALKKDTYFSTQLKKISINESQQKDYHGVPVLEFVIECAN